MCRGWLVSKIAILNFGTHSVFGKVVWVLCGRGGWGRRSGQIHAVESGREMEGQGVGIWFGLERDDERRFSSMMRADNYWIFSLDREN